MFSYKLLEPYDVKVSRTVLRGERGSNPSALPDFILKGQKMKRAFVFDLFGTLVEIREKSDNRNLLEEMSEALDLEFEEFHNYWSNMLG